MTAGGDATAKKTSQEKNAPDARTDPSDQTAADKGRDNQRELFSREKPKDCWWDGTHFCVAGLAEKVLKDSRKNVGNFENKVQPGRT